MTGIGMLTLTGNNVAMDSFGPIADNANGIGEMAWHGIDDDETNTGRKIMTDLDAVGNTTKAITKGIAIGSAVIAGVSLFGSFLVETTVPITFASTMSLSLYRLYSDFPSALLPVISDNRFSTISLLIRTSDSSPAM